MAKTTRIYFDEIWSYDNQTRIFRTNNQRITALWVKDFKDGIAFIDPAPGDDITNFAEVIAGCFTTSSNFDYEVKKAFGCENDFNSIQFTFNGATVTVTKENADPKSIYEAWDKTMDENAEKARLEHEAWLKTEEGQKYLAEQEEERKREEIQKEKIHKLDKEIEMEFKDEEAKKGWEKFVENNSDDPYSYGVVKYARFWAKLMQHQIAETGKTVAEIADQTSHDAYIEGITGFMYGCAVNVLAHCWKYGEELRRWHNGEYNYNGDGVVNPAILTIKAD